MNQVEQNFRNQLDPATGSPGVGGMYEQEEGLWKAVEEFVADGTWRVKQRYTNNNGLTVLQKDALA